MKNVMVVSNSKELRHQIQQEVNSFKNDSDLSFILKFISVKFGCDCEVAYPRNKGGEKYLYCYLPADA